MPDTNTERSKFITDTIATVNRAIVDSSTEDELIDNLHKCFEVAFSKVSAKHRNSYWQQLNLRLHRDKIAVNANDTYQLLRAKGGSEAAWCNLVSAKLNSFKPVKPKSIFSLEGFLAFCKSIPEYGSTLITNIESFPAPLRWLANFILTPIRVATLGVVGGGVVLLSVEMLFRSLTARLLNLITNSAYYDALTSSNFALSTKEALFYNLKGKVLLAYKESIEAVSNPHQLNPNLIKEMGMVNAMTFDPDNPDTPASALLERLESFPIRALPPFPSKDNKLMEEKWKKLVYAATQAHGATRINFVARALYHSITSPLPEGLGSKIAHMLFLRPLRLILAPLFLTLTLLQEVVLYVTMGSLLGTILALTAVLLSVAFVFNIPHFIVEGIKSLMHCCKKKNDLPPSPSSDATTNPAVASSSNAAEALNMVDSRTAEEKREAASKAEESTLTGGVTSHYAHPANIHGTPKDRAEPADTVTYEQLANALD